MRSRSAIEFVDVVAATFVVGSDLIEADFNTIGEALDNLPTFGGKVFVLTPIDVASSITVPDKDFEIEWAFGATLTFSGTGAVFDCPTGFTTFRTPVFTNLYTQGPNTATDSIVKLNDVNSYCHPTFQNPYIRNWRIAVNIAAGDVAYIDPVIVRFYGGSIESPDSSSPLIKSPNVAGTYAFGASIYFFATSLFGDLGGSVIPWALDFDGDFICSGTQQLTIADGSKIDGLDMAGGWINGIGGVVNLECLGANYWANSMISGVGMDQVNLKLSGACYKLQAFSFRSTTITLNNVSCVVDIVNGPTVTVAVSVDVLAGANGCIVTGVFADHTTAAIRTAALRGSFRGTFASTGTHKTVLETGAADFNSFENCPGLSSGAGPTIIGPSSSVEGATLYDKAASSTNALVAAVPTITNPKGLQGIGWIKNTGGSNSIDVKESFTDAFGTTSTLTTTVTFGNTLPLSLGIAIGTGLPPYVSYKVEVIDTVAGNHSTYVAHFTAQGVI